MKLKIFMILLFFSFSSKVQSQSSCDTCLYAIAYLYQEGFDSAFYGIKWDNNTKTDLDEYYKMKRPWNEFHLDSKMQELKLFNFMNSVGYDLVTATKAPMNGNSSYMTYEWFFRRRVKF